MSDSSAVDERSASSPAPVATDQAHGRGTALAGSALVAAPDRIVTSFLAGAIPVGIAVVFHVFVPIVVLPAVVLAVVALWRWMPSRYLAAPQRRAWWDPRTVPDRGAVADRGAGTAARTGFWTPAAIGSAAALLVMLIWIWVNRQHLSAYVVLNRDPGIYTLRGLWLVHHSTPLMDFSSEALQAGGVPGVSVASPAFPVIGTTVYPQSSALVPGLLAVLGWFFGLHGVLAADLLIGAFALLAVYAFARRLLGPLWALLPMVTLAATMPMVSFSRAPYSEPVALMATFGGLTLLWIAWQTGKLGQFFAAGLLIGVGSLARIDGGVTLIGVLAGFAVVTLGARSPDIRRKAALAGTAWAVGAGALNAISLVDGNVNSPVYQASEWGGIFPLLVGTILAYLVMVACAFVPLGPIRRSLAADSRVWARWVLIASGIIALIMISRPLWWTSTSQTPALQAALAQMQKGLGLPVNGTRSYSEHSVSWMAIYLSWPVVILAAVGAGLLLARTVSRRDPRLAAFVLTVGAVSALYLNQVNIFPDQIWAMRRFLPVVLPGLIIAAVYPLTRLPRLARVQRFSRYRTLLAVVAGVLAFGVVISPMVGFRKSHLWPVANDQAQIAEMADLCSAVGDHPVILAGPPSGSSNFVPTFKAGCGTEVVTYAAPTTAGLATLQTQFTDPARGSDTSAPIVVVFDPKSVTWQGETPAPYITTTLTTWNQPIQQRPYAPTTGVRSIWIGTVGPDGKIAPLSTAPTIVNGP